MARYIVALPGGARLLLQVDADGALARLSRIEDRAKNLQPLLEAIAGVMREAFGKRFAQGGSPPWAPLAASTIASKMLAQMPARTGLGRVPWRLKQNGSFGPANILIRTGALRDSYRQKNAPGHIERIDAEAGTVFVGSALRYARYHQKGTAPYTIRAKAAKTLAFTGSGGETIFRRAVQHPGLSARPVLLDASDRAAIAGLARAYLRGEEIRRAA